MTLSCQLLPQIATHELVRVIVTLCCGAVASLTAWFGAGRVLDDRARQDLADRWAEAELCLVGPGMSSGARPSGRLRAIAMAPSAAKSGWPERCATAAAALDAALAAPPIYAELADVPRLTPALSLAADARAAAVDGVWEALRGAKLPAGRPGRVEPPPAGASARLVPGDLRPLASEMNVADVVIDRGAREGELRLVVPGPLAEWCIANPETRAKPPAAGEAEWSTLVCRRASFELFEEARFAMKEAGAPDLLYLRAGVEDGLFDASSGQRIWRPRFEKAEAFVAASGATTLLYGERLGREPGEAIDDWRIVRFVPGRAPKNRRSEIAPSASALLIGDALAWWDRGGTSLSIAAIDAETRLSRRAVLSSWQPPDRLVERCFAGDTAALSFAAGDRGELLVHLGGVWRITPLPLPRGSLACRPGAVGWIAEDGAGFVGRRCSAAGCVASSGKLPSARIRAVAWLGDEAVVMHGEPGGPLRVTFAPGSNSARELLLFDDSAHGGLGVRAVRLVAGERRLVALIEDDRRRVFALGLDAHGEASALAPRPW